MNRLLERIFAFFGYKPRIDYADPTNWTIGPIMQGTNYSVGLPLHPNPHTLGWCIDLSPYFSSVHYVTAPCRSLAGKKEIVLRFRIKDQSISQSGKLFPSKFPQSPAEISLFIQRRGDNASGQGEYETYRWWSPNCITPLCPGEFELRAPLNGDWTAVQTSHALTSPFAFQAALQNAEQIGFTFGGGDGKGHGVSATQPMRFTCTHFEII